MPPRCVRGLGKVLMHNDTRVLSPRVRTDDDLLRECRNASQLAKRIASSDSLQAALAQSAALDVSIHRIAARRFENDVQRARAAGFLEATPTQMEAAAAPPAFAWVDAMPPFPEIAMRVGVPIGLPPKARCPAAELPPGTFAYSGNKVLVPVARGATRAR